MVNFVKSGGQDTEFADNNITPSIDTFKASAVWIYSPDKKLVSSTSNLGGDKAFDPAANQPIETGDFEKLFKTNGVFQVYTPNTKSMVRL